MGSARRAGGRTDRCLCAAPFLRAGRAARGRPRQAASSFVARSSRSRPTTLSKFLYIGRVFPAKAARCSGVSGLIFISVPSLVAAAD